MSFRPDEFAARLTDAIDAASLTQRQVASRLGVHPNRVNEWAHGRGVPKIAQVVTLGELLEVSLDWLLAGSETADSAERRLVDEFAGLAPSLTRLATRARQLARAEGGGASR